MPRLNLMRVTISSLAIMTMLLVPSVAYATPPLPSSGSFTDSASVLTFAGTEVGTCAGPITVVLHADGTFNFRGKCTFTGTVGGSGSGSAKYRFEGTGSGISFTGHLVGGHGTGGLSGLHLEHRFAGAFTSATTTAGTYSGHY